jgi:predicted DNA-binding protein (UPF0251 family)
MIEVVVVPRRRKRCWVESLPEATYYKPAGVPLRELEEITLSVEELEAIRLKDLDGLDQEQCAERMGIARTTFQRHLYAAHAKIADALVKGKALRIEGGEFEMSSARRFTCTACGHEFEVPFCNGQRGRDMTCPNCGQGPVCRAGSGRQSGCGGPGLRRGALQNARNTADTRSTTNAQNASDQGE